MFFFPLTESINFYDILMESLWLTASSIICFAMWKLYFFYKKNAWLIASIGATFFSVGSIIDIMDEIYILPFVLDNIIEDNTKLTGYILFAIGVISITYLLINMAHTDSLTGIYNRRFLLEILYKEIERSKRDNTVLSIVFIDIDRFKQINDLFGHITGDYILKKIALKLKETIRQVDFLARFGGDEFVILMPNTNLTEANSVMKRLNDKITEIKLSDGREIKTSFGISQYPKDETHIDNLLSIASKRMYDHKEK